MASGFYPACLAVSFVFALLTPLGAQDTYFVCDSSDDVIYRMVDFDGDGMIDPVTETNVYYDDSSVGPDLSNPSHLLVLGNSLLVSDAGTLDAVLRLEDLNGDGDANDPGEVIPYYDDSSPGIDLSTPNGLAPGPDGSVYVTDDGAAVRSILRLVDLNADRDANDADEVTIFYDTSALAPMNPIFDAESIAVTEDGVVYVGDSTNFLVFRVEDLNNDGDALDAGEASIYYSIAGGVPIQDIDSLAVDSQGGLYAVDEDDGTVLYLRDLNADLDALDPGEVTVFVDGDPSSDPNDAILLADGTLLLADGALDALIIAEDLNGNGVATDPGETRFLFDDGGTLLATPSGVAVVPAGVPVSPPAIFALQPASGTTAGGTPTTISGAFLADVQEVRFGAALAAGFTVIDDATIATTTPPASAGTVDVTVATPAGTAVLVAGFVYVAPGAVVIDSLEPAVGTVSGGTEVLMSGSGWNPAEPLEVLFDGSSAGVVAVAPGAITVSTPAHTPGLVDVEVIQGGSASVAAGAFRYLTPFLRGNVDLTGPVNLADAVLLLRYVFAGPGPLPPCLDALDIDDDNAIEVDDGIALLAFLFQNGPPPAPPFPDVGLDPTPPGPGCAP